MPDEQYVRVDALATVVKILLLRITDLTMSVMVLRAALMEASALPVSVSALQHLDSRLRAYEPLRRTREYAESLKVVDTNAELLEWLRKFEGPIQ